MKRMMKIFLAVAVIAGVTAPSMALDKSYLMPKRVPGFNKKAERAKIALGNALFHDRRMSKDGTVSCSDCHPLHNGAGADNVQFGVGVIGGKAEDGLARRAGRNDPSNINAALHLKQFWDGRAADIEDQAGGPPLADGEMAMADGDAVAARINLIPGYVEDFADIYGSVSFDNFKNAIATFEKTLLTRGSRVDRFIKSGKGLTAQEERGLEAFEAKGCTACHSGPNFDGAAAPTSSTPNDAGFFKFPLIADLTDDTIGTDGALTGTDLTEASAAINHTDNGRGDVTSEASDAKVFKTPGLRTACHTAPYFHTGNVTKLTTAIKVMAVAQSGQSITDAEADDIKAFICALTGKLPKFVKPELPLDTGETVTDPQSL